MKITGVQTEQKNIVVDVSIDNAIHCIVTHFLTEAKIGGLYQNEYLTLENGKIWKEYEEHGSHSWFTRKVIVENPSVQQVNVLKYVHILQDAFKELKRNTDK